MSVINGVVIGIVTNVRKGEAKVKFPWLHQRDEEEKESNWVRIATAMAGDDKGTFLMPEVGDEVLVAFEQGDFNHPYIIGFLWNGKDKPPENDTKKRVIKTKSGHTITLSDKNGEEEIKIKHKTGSYILMDSTGKIKFKGILGDEQVAILKGWIDHVFALHTHTGNLGAPTSPPLPPMNNSMAPTGIKDFTE